MAGDFDESEPTRGEVLDALTAQGQANGEYDALDTSTVAIEEAKRAAWERGWAAGFNAAMQAREEATDE